MTFKDMNNSFMFGNYEIVSLSAGMTHSQQPVLDFKYFYIWVTSSCVQILQIYVVACTWWIWDKLL